MTRRLAAVVAAALAFAAPVHAAGPPFVDARAYVVVDASNGRVLASSNAHEQVPIASITKLMTVLVALEHVQPSDVVIVRRRAAAVGESTIDLRAGQRLSVHDLIEGALIQSANDAAYALADYAGNGDVSTFVAEMNAKAQELGLRDTHFVRPDGLDAPGERSSAADVTMLARIVMRIPLIRDVVRKQTDVIAGGRALHTWNDLLGVFPGMIGVKTGHTSLAGWCEVAAARSTAATVYATILGSPSRAQRNADLEALLRWGLGRYRVARVIATGRTYAFAETGWGHGAVALVAATSLRRSVRVDQPLVAEIVARAAVALPVHAGDQLGVVRVWQGKRLLGSRPLFAATAVRKPGLGGRIGFYARRTVKHLFGWFT
ncbi:MAG: D-alanyl-D-alanine carboxypeptidase family protein [Gaiellaceae bacterium]